MKPVAALGLLGLVTLSLPAQDNATVEGVVVNKVTGGGIGGATVRFRANRTTTYQAVTDEAGAFRIDGMKPGDYGSSVEKTGYFSPESLVLGDPLRNRISPAGEPLRVRFELNPPAVLRGHVVDMEGNPARAAVDLGRGRTVYTNADGLFVFENLAPGMYMLLARPKAIEHVYGKEEVRREAVTTFYPSVVDRTQAESIVVRAGAELNGYEIRLQSVPVYRVRGMVLDLDGKPAAKAVVELHASAATGGADALFADAFFFVGRGAFSIRNGPFGIDPSEDEPVVTGKDGVFEFPAVRAGEWRLRAESDPIRDAVRSVDISSVGNATFSLGRGDLDDLKIQMVTPFSLSGIAVMSDGSPVTSDVIVAVSLVSENGHSGGGSPNAEARGVLRFDNVIPGAHQIRADAISGNYYADSVFLGSNDVTGQTVQLMSASPQIKVVLKPAGTIRGTIEEADAGSVLLFPQSLAGVAYYVQSGAGKSFELTGVPPGDYYVIALDRFDPRTMAETILLRGLMPRATSVRVEQGASASVRLKVNHAPD